MNKQGGSKNRYYVQMKPKNGKTKVDNLIQEQSVCKKFNQRICLRYSVTDKPRGTRLTSDAQNDTVTENSQVTFYCTAESLPQPELQLHFEHSPLGFFSNGRFTLKHINASNQGAYGCIPRNILGTGPEAALHLIVLGKCLDHNG